MRFYAAIMSTEARHRHQSKRYSSYSSEIKRIKRNSVQLTWQSGFNPSNC